MLRRLRARRGQDYTNGNTFRRNNFGKAVAKAIEPLEGRLLLTVVNSLVDPLTGPGVDTAKWAITNRGLENNGPAGYNDPVEDANGLVLGGTTFNQYWYGSSLESQDDFSSQARTTVQVERVSLTGSGDPPPTTPAWRSSLWLLQPGGEYLHFAENVGENNWEYNANNTGSGTAIPAFNSGTQIDHGDHTMKIVYIPGSGTTADFQIYLDGNLGPTVHYTAWDHSKTFKVILTGQARTINDSVSATFKNFSAVADPIPTDPPAAPTNLTAVAATQGLGATLTWLDNANNEISYRVERSTDGVKYTEVASLPAVTGSGSTITYNDSAPAAGTKFYYRVRAFNNANSGSFSGYSSVATATTVPAITSLIDPLTGNGVDTTKWDITNRGLEATGPAGYTATEDANGLVLGGTATKQYWYGASLESKGLFNSQASTTVTVDRVSLTGSGTAWRSSLWLLQPVAGGQFLHFAENMNESGWQYNQTGGGGGTSITSFPDDGADHVMKLVYTPLGFTNAKVDIYLDNQLGATANFTNWDNTVPFKVILTGQARATGDTAAATFKSFSAVADPLPNAPAAPGNLSVTAGATAGTVDLQWTDNADNELEYTVERSADGSNWTTLATPAAVEGTGAALTSTDTPPVGGATYFYRVRAFNYAALSTFVSSPVLVATPVAPPTLTDLTDSFTGTEVDTSKWDITNRGLENSGDAGYYDPTEDSTGVSLSGIAANQYWYGKSLESKGVFSSATTTTVSVHRVFLYGYGSGYRSSLWLYQPGGQFLHFAQDVNETNWEYNQTAGNQGTAISAFNDPNGPYLDGGDHEMKLVYTPLGGTKATVDMYLDGVLGATANFTNWDNSQPFKVILTGQARAINDEVTATFSDLAVSTAPTTPTTITGTAAADNFYLKADADGTHADIWVNAATPGAGAPTQQILFSQGGQLTFDGQGGDDVLTVDYSAGNPVPGAGVLFQGGAGNDQLKTIGAGAADALGFIGRKVQHAGSGLVTAATDVERLGVSAAAFATPIVTPGTAGNFGAYDVGKGGSVQLFYSGASPVAQVRQALSAGRNGGAWDGPGLTSTDAGLNRAYGIGYTDDGAGTILLKYVQAADATLDGKVDFNDLVKLAQNYNVTGGRTWDTGDFNYDGATDFNDLVMLAQNYNTSAAAAGTPLSAAAAQSLATSWAAALAPAPTKTPTPVKPRQPVPKPVVAPAAPIPAPKVSPFASSKKVGAKDLLA
jgi:hypothetical protein